MSIESVMPSNHLILLSPSPLSFNLSQHQGLLKGVSSSHKAAKVLEFQLQHQSLQWIFRIDFLQDRLVGFPCSPRDSQESSPTPQFKSINSSALSFLHSPTFISIQDHWRNHSLNFSSVSQLYPTLCDPMNCSTPGLPVHHQLLAFTQTHVHRVSDAIQTSHPLLSPSPPAPNPSQHQSIFH